MNHLSWILNCQRSGMVKLSLNLRDVIRGISGWFRAGSQFVLGAILMTTSSFSDAAVLPYLSPLPENILVELTLLQAEAGYRSSDLDPIGNLNSDEATSQLVNKPVQSTSQAVTSEARHADKDPHCFGGLNQDSDRYGLKNCPLESQYQTLELFEDESGELTARRSKADRSPASNAASSTLDLRRIRDIAAEELYFTEAEQEEISQDLRRLTGAQLSIDQDLDPILYSLGLEDSFSKRAEINALPLVQAHLERRFGISVSTSQLIVHLLKVSPVRN